MNLIDKAKKNKKTMNRLFVFCIGLIEVIILAIIITTCCFLFYTEGFEKHIYGVIAVDLIVLWIGILVGYYAWAIYFYNINLGLTNEDWAEIRQKEIDGEQVKVREKNPNENNTLGLPDGTIRGTLALSLAVGAMAMLIASMGQDNTVPLNKLFVDAFDFFKTAFLMMIAFYFGNKSLQYLNYKGGPVKGGSGQPSQQNTMADESQLQPTLPPAANPELVGVRSQLNEQQEGPNDVADDKKVSADFDKPDAKG